MITSKTPWIFTYAILLHLVYAVALWTNPAALHITAIHSLVDLGITTGAGAARLYSLVALLASLGLVAPKPANVFLLLPQQIVLLSSAFGALAAMVAGSFADGVLRPHMFLVADQAPAVIAAVLHTLALWYNVLKGDKNG